MASFVNSSDGSVVARNTVHDNAAGILLCCSVNNVVRDNLVFHNSEEGIGVCCGTGSPSAPAGGGNRIEDNDVLDNTQLGIGVFFGGQDVLVRGNRVAGNGDNIVVADSSGNTIT